MQLDHGRRRGANAILVGGGLIVMIGFAALAVDIGYAYAAKAQLQNAVDMAAVSAAWRLDGTAEGVREAPLDAIATAAMSDVFGAGVVLADADIETGTYDKRNGTFTPGSDPSVTNAIRISTTMGDLPSFFGSVVFGVSSLSARAEATGVARAIVPTRPTNIECIAPVAIPSCLLDRYPGQTIQNADLVLNPAGIDTMGWGRPGQDPDAEYIRNQFGDCEGAGRVNIGDDVHLMNGVVSSGLSALADAINASTDRWDNELYGLQPAQATRSAVTSYGNVLETPIMIFSGGAEYCTGSGGSYTGEEEIVGFGWATFYDVVATGRADEKNIKLRIDMTRDHVVPGDGSDDTGDGTGVYAPPGGAGYIVR